MPRLPPRWTEDELRREIAHLDAQITQCAGRGDRRSRCAASYLRQVLRDRCEALRSLNHGKLH